MCKALEDLYQDGVQRGLEEGRNEGIKALVLDYQEEGFSQEKIVLKLVKLFSLSTEAALEYYEKFSIAA